MAYASIDHKPHKFHHRYKKFLQADIVWETLHMIFEEKITSEHRKKYYMHDRV